MSPSFSSPTASHAVTLVFNGRSALAALILRDSRVTTLSCSSIWSEARVRMCWCMSQAALLYSLSPRRCLRKLDVHIAHNHTTLTLPPLCMGQHDGKGIHRREERGQWRGKEARTPEPEPFQIPFLAKYLWSQRRQTGADRACLSLLPSLRCASPSG